jgi:hypothetical protein
LFRKGSTVAGFIGIDGGSTSTKAVLLDENGGILCKSYQLSNGNPIQDTIGPDSRARMDQSGQRAHRIDAEPKPAPHRDSTRSEHLRVRASVQRLF